MEENTQIWDSIGRVLTGNASPADYQKTGKWLEADPARRQLFAQLKAYWNDKSVEEPAYSLQLETRLAWAKLETSLNAVEPKKNNSRAWLLPAVKVAAALLPLLVFLGWLAFEKPGNGLETVQTGSMSKHIVLEDGSKVWINEHSTLEYPKHFAGSLREVNLSGEAYFEVAASPENPFVIHLRQGTVRVVGTKFNIRSVQGETLVETSVISGKVEFLPPAAPKDQAPRPMLLNPNSRASYNTQTGLLSVTQSESALDAAWKDGLLVFRETPMKEVARILQKHYRKPVILADSKLEDCPLTASFAGETLEEVLEIVALTGEFTYTYFQDSVAIAGKGCQ